MIFGNSQFIRLLFILYIWVFRKKKLNYFLADAMHVFFVADRVKKRLRLGKHNYVSEEFLHSFALKFNQATNPIFLHVY